MNCSEIKYAKHVVNCVVQGQTLVMDEVPLSALRDVIASLFDVTKLTVFNPLSPEQYATVCTQVFNAYARRSSDPLAHRYEGLLPLNPNSEWISLETLAMKAILNHNHVVLTAVLPHIDPTYHHSLLLREALQNHNTEAVHLLRPLSRMDDVTHFAVEMAARSGKPDFLDAFLPHADPTQMDYFLLRHAAHRYKEDVNSNASTQSVKRDILRRVMERTNQICEERGAPWASLDVSALPLVRNIQHVLADVATEVNLKHHLKEAVEQASARSTRRKI